MNTEETQTQQEQESSPVYIIGAVVIVAIIIAGVLLWPKPTPKQTATTPVVEKKEMITKLSCDKQWYNPKIGYPEYYLSAEGGALASTTTVDCTFTIIAAADGKILATEKIPATLTQASERGGQTFQCTTKAVALPKGTKVTMTTMVKDNGGTSASCAAGAITLP